MADDNAQADVAAADIQQGGQPKLVLNTQFLQDMSFENPAGASIFTKGELKPQVRVNLNVDSRRLGEVVYEVALKINAEAKLEEEVCFLVELDYRGIFTLSGVEEQLIPQILLIEGPRTIFPFARRIVADAARDGGFPPLLIDPVDFRALYQQHQSRRTQDNESGVGATVTQSAGTDTPTEAGN